MDTENEINELGEILLETGTLLMSNGASTARIRLTIDRIAGTYGYQSDLFISHRALTLNLSDDKHEHMFNRLKRTSPHGVNFKLVSGLSRLSWRVEAEKLGLDTMREEITRIKNLSHYPRLLTLSTVGLAGSAFCYFTGGSILEMLITFIATFIGLFIRQEAHKKQLNANLCVYFGAFAATMVSGLFTKINVGTEAEHAFATSVLFLIPGVPLINCFTDLFDGNILNGIVRGTQGLLFAFMIALGLLSSYLIYQF